jgi:hypothetical protein
MTTLIERTRSVTTLLKEHAARRTAEERARHLQERIEEVGKARDGLNIVAVPAAVLRRAGRLSSNEVRAPAKLLEALVTLRQRALDVEPEKFASVKEYKRWRDLVATHTTTVAERAADAWKGVKADFPSVEKKILEEIAEIPGQKVAVTRALEIHARLRTEARDLPVSDATYERVLAIAKELQEALNGLDDKHFPPAVRAFLRAVVSPSGAAPTALTAEVRAWLDAQNMGDRIRLRWVSA